MSVKLIFFSIVKVFVQIQINILIMVLLHFQDLENTFDGWTGDLAHLTVLRESLSCYISAEDLSVLQERIELLHRQWDEICHQVQLLAQYLPILD